MVVSLRLPLLSPPPPSLSDQNSNHNRQPPLHRWPRRSCSRRDAIILTSIVLPSITLAPSMSFAASDSPEKANASTQKPFLDIVNTRSWYQFIGDGFAIRMPPEFNDVIEPEPENDNGGLTYYGDRAEVKPFAARFASPDRSETVSVVITPSNQLKITFLAATDITDLGSLKEAAKIFVPGGATLYSGRTIKVKEEEKFKTYYFYEFGYDKQHVALVAAVNSGKAYVAGATAPEMNWETDGVKLRSAAISLDIYMASASGIYQKIYANLCTSLISTPKPSWGMMRLEERSLCILPECINLLSN